ncbi:CobW family GTP-binding protein [Desulfolucanica intricata]|uniref:CobW family GTP-binding protein n=1 Tax=Desulfolucanica intricata TaxID=1285191 RepID=UPI00082EDFE5|nr:GTP-binding protein [Desulfolucanica intricata]
MVKLDIVSGFLGAGKTTLIKKILSACTTNKEKVILIENEFGQVSVDSEILRIEGFQIYELSRGCVCCTLRDDFIFTLKQILTQNPVRIIVEPSGIFILGEIFDLFKDPEISSKCYINSVTTVVDGVNYCHQKNSFSSFLENQIANASTLVISKTQFLEPSKIPEIVKELQQVNDTAAITSKNWSNLSVQEILLLLDGNTKYALNNIISSPAAGFQHSRHNHSFETLGLRTTRNIEKPELENILERFKRLEYGHILRGKGFIKANNTNLEFSYVDGKYNITKANSQIPGMVSLIGTGLQRDKLIAAFT